MGYTKVGLVKSENVNHHVATRDPLPTDDVEATSGSVVTSVANGDLWLNTLTATLFVCTDNTNGAAVWKLANGGKAFKKATFDASAGVAVGTTDLNLNLPAGAVITNATYVVRVTFTSATDAGELQIAIDAVDDDAELIEIQSSTAISAVGDIWDAGVPPAEATTDSGTDGTLDNALAALSENGTVRIEVATEDLTDGELDVYIEYFLP
jgi:hypothetical protein